MTLERKCVPLSPPPGGWLHPWPNVFELAQVMATDKRTLVGGVMVQAHALAHGVTLTRPTDDVDVLLHIEIDTTAAAQANEHIPSSGPIGQVIHRSCARERVKALSLLVQ